MSTDRTGPTEGAESSEKTASGLEKLLERVPYAEGALRRRLIAGIIFTSCFFGYLLLRNGSFYPIDALLPRLKALNVDLGALFKSTQFIVALLLFVYALGTVIEVTADSFIVRGVAAVSTLVGPSARLLGGLIIAAWPISILLGFIYSTFGHKLYRLDFDIGPDQTRKATGLREPLSAEAFEFYKRLADNVSTGLNAPFGGKFEAAWQAVVYMTPDSHKQWVVRLSARNHEMSSFLAAAFLGTLSCALHDLFTAGGKFGWTIYGLYVTLWLISYFFFGYLSVVRRSIASVLEFLAFMDREPIAPGATGFIVKANA